MGLWRHTKTEHNGAKNGGGAWDTRAVAKQTAKKLRRRADRAEAVSDVTPSRESFPVKRTKED